MKRKNTKVYRELVQRYCDNRYEFEQRTDDVNEHNRIIDENKTHFSHLNDNVKSDAFVVKWFNEFIKMHELNVIFGTQIIDHFSDDMDKDGEILKNDYGEDLDALYNSYQENMKNVNE